MGTLEWATAGQVVTERDEDGLPPPGYIGARAHTNNTGELSAMHHALRRALTRPRGAGCEIIHTDSLYAMNMTTGKWMPRRGLAGHRNRDLITRLRTLWRRVQRARPREVEIRHVRSHIQVPGNELADWLAEVGAKGDGGDDMLEGATTWLRGWLRQQHDGMGGRNDTAPSGPLPGHGGRPPGGPVGVG